MPDPDKLLILPGATIATADSGVLDRAGPWLNLAREIVAAIIPGASSRNLVEPPSVRTGRSLPRFVLEHLAPLHDELDALQLADVGEGVAQDGDDVGELAGSMAPRSFSACSSSAATTVADWIAWAGVIP